MNNNHATVRTQSGAQAYAQSPAPAQALPLLLLDEIFLADTGLFEAEQWQTVESLSTEHLAEQPHSVSVNSNQSLAKRLMHLLDKSGLRAFFNNTLELPSDLLPLQAIVRKYSAGESLSLCRHQAVDAAQQWVICLFIADPERYQGGEILFENAKRPLKAQRHSLAVFDARLAYEILPFRSIENESCHSIVVVLG